MTYYGLSLNVGNLGGSLRVNFLLSCTVELAGYLAAWLLLERVGRKRSHCCFMLVAGLACLATILTVSLGGKGMYAGVSSYCIDPVWTAKVCKLACLAFVLILSELQRYASWCV